MNAIILKLMQDERVERVTQEEKSNILILKVRDSRDFDENYFDELQELDYEWVGDNLYIRD